MRYLSHQEVFNKQFCFIRCRRQQLQAVEKRRYSRFTFVEIPVSHLPKVLRAKFLGSDRPFCFISICKFDGFKTFFAMITSLCELYFRFRRYILLVKMKRVISMSEVVAKVDENHREDWGLTWYLQWYIHQFQPNPPTKFTSNSRSTEFKDILWWNISQLIPKTVSSSMRIVISYAMKWGIPFWWKVNGNLDNNMIRISQWSKSHCKTYSSIRKKK